MLKIQPHHLLIKQAQFGSVMNEAASLTQETIVQSAIPALQGARLNVCTKDLKTYMHTNDTI